jgi:predicted Rossmann fold nucleotide-binding protein DprA/Smf involved in DNA uptake
MPRNGAYTVPRAGWELVASGSHIQFFHYKKRALTNTPDPRWHPSWLDKPSEMLLDALGFEPASIDEQVDRSGLQPASIASMLLILELDLRIEPQPGGR